ncbi:MAG: hypothetical protein LBV67_06805 [Streptococcaceae bacterium]|jgi:hypothetical protein|nr:hypothetical protein [Streptococcaceae bacterium]
MNNIFDSLIWIAIFLLSIAVIALSINQEKQKKELKILKELIRNVNKYNDK